MVFQHIENLQQEYTDKYVVVDQEQPELQRFHGMTGIVRTVNMNGRALVEFDGYNNIGWYDIDIDFLRVIDKPLPEQAEEEKPATVLKEDKEDKEDKAPSELKKAREKDSGEMSVDEILAAAKGDSATSPAEETSTADASAMSVDDILAAARTGSDTGGEAASEEIAAKEKTEKPAPAAVQAADASAMSVDDILAAARAGTGAGDEAASEDEPAEEEAEGAVEEEDAAGEDAEAETEEPAAPAGELPDDVDGIITYCRRVDGK